jgi:hypothetical protein
MSILRRIASALLPSPEGAAVSPPWVGRREAVTGCLSGAGEVARGTGAKAGVPRGRPRRFRPGGDRDHLAALWVDLGGSD